MKLKFIKDDDFVNYKKCSLFLGVISCDWKCCKEGGFSCNICQNYGWNANAIIEVSDEFLIERYLSDGLEEGIVFGGLEPFLQFNELYAFIKKFRERSKDDVVIYTGYYKEEINSEVEQLKKFPNIIIKYGRYIPNRSMRRDEVLGVTLASDNQYAEKIS